MGPVPVVQHPNRERPDWEAGCQTAPGKSGDEIWGQPEGSLKTREVPNAIRQSRIRWNRVLGFWKHSRHHALLECEPLYLVDDRARRL